MASEGPCITALTLYHFSPHPSFISGREIKKRKCLFGLHARIPPPVEPLTGDGAPTRSLVQGGWGNSQGINGGGIRMEMGRSLGCPGGGWGDKEASYSFPSGQGPGGGVSRPLGKRRRPEPEPLRRRQKGKMEELGPPSAVRNQPEPQEQRERARLQRALQVQGQGDPHGAKWWCGKESRIISQSFAPSSRPQCLHHPPALTRVTRAAAATTSGPQTPAACPGQCSFILQPVMYPWNFSSHCLHPLDFLTQNYFPSPPWLLTSYPRETSSTNV